MQDANQFSDCIDLYRWSQQCLLYRRLLQWRNSAGQLSVSESIIAVPPASYGSPLNEEGLRMQRQHHRWSVVCTQIHSAGHRWQSCSVSCIYLTFLHFTVKSVIFRQVLAVVSRSSVVLLVPSCVQRSLPGSKLKRILSSPPECGKSRQTHARAYSALFSDRMLTIVSCITCASPVRDISQ
jgi:hypothetical protein